MQYTAYKLHYALYSALVIRRRVDETCAPSPICFSMSAASSGVARGRIPGSVKLVWRREMTTNTNRTPPMAGMQLVRCFTRNGQLEPHNASIRKTLIVEQGGFKILCCSIKLFHSLQLCGFPIPRLTLNNHPIKRTSKRMSKVLQSIENKHNNKKI